MNVFPPCINHSRNFFLGLAFFFAINANIAQSTYSLDVTNYKELEASGTIPDDFLVSWADKLDTRMNSEKSDDLDRLELFWTRNHAFIDQLLQSGKLCFNDPFTNYLNEIKNELLKEEPYLRDEIRIYTSKGPSLNAATVADGIIIVNIGLFAYANTEAEIAYVLCHEIQHYKQEHSLEAFDKREALLEESVKDYRNLHPIKKLELLIQQSKENEYEADELGLRLFYKSTYNTKAPIDLLTLLHRSYLPYNNDSVGKDFLTTTSQHLPETFFRDKIKPISREEDYFDDTHTHPNIFKRKIALDPFLKSGGDTNDFIIKTEQEFLKYREFARFERVNQLANYGYYGDALYDIYVLKKKYPTNKFLDLTAARCLYGLASFKAIDKISKVARSTGKIEGASQQVHNVIKEFNSIQLVSYSLHYIQELQKKYSDEKNLQFYADQLSRYLVVYCGVDAEEFATETDVLLPFSKTEADFDNVRKYMRAKQKHYDNFYKYALKESYKNGWLASAIANHQYEADSIYAYIDLDADGKEDVNDEIAERWEEGSGLKLRKVVVLDPFLRVYGSNDDPEELREGLEKEQAFKGLLPELFKNAGIEAELLYSENLLPTDVEKYTKFAKLKTQITEAQIFDRFNLTPPIVASSTMASNYSSNYICLLQGYILDGKKDYYRFVIYNLKKGKIVYSYFDSKGYDLSLNDLEKETIKNLERVYN